MLPSDWRNWTSSLRPNPGLDAGDILMENCWRFVLPCSLLTLLLAGCGSTETSWSSHLVGEWHGTTRVDKAKLAATLDPRPRDAQLDVIFADLEKSEYRLVFRSDGTILFDVLPGLPDQSSGRWQITVEQERRLTVRVESGDDAEAVKILNIQFVNPDIFQIHTGPTSAPDAIIQKYKRQSG